MSEKTSQVQTPQQRAAEIEALRLEIGRRIGRIDAPPLRVAEALIQLAVWLAADQPDIVPSVASHFRQVADLMEIPGKGRG